MKGLTAKQAAVLACITERIDATGMPPTRREIGARLGVRSVNGVNDHLEALARKGYLARDPRRSRGLRVLRRLTPKPATAGLARLLPRADGGLALFWPIAASDPVGELPLAHAS